ncbi:uncharacterized protein [Apostichopus japonicus]|uniref:uncharacterized protein isoform X3 n=1 Tax=Stichopus japonicus TaxID=307972 RepID=UPI003AB3CE3A
MFVFGQEYYKYQLLMQTRSNKNQQQPTAYADFIKKKKDPSGFEVKYVSEEVGYGLFATADFEKGEFLLEYSGVLRHAYQVGEEEDTTFIFFFQSGQDSMCIDATHSTGKGKYCNDDWKKPNAVVKKIIINKQPKLAIFANSEIKKGNEIRYDYGQPDARWRKKKKTNQNKPPEVLRECNTDNEPERAPGESECTTQIAKKQTNQNKPPEVLRECNTDNEPERAPGESECTTQIAKKNTNQNKPPEVLRECNTDNEPERAPGESECTTQIVKKQTNQNKPPEVLRECNTDNEPERAPVESECTTQIAKKNTNQNKPPEVLRECNTDNEPERAPGESECTTQIVKKQTNQNKPPEVLRECNTDNEPERAPGESECTTQIAKDNESDDSYNPFEDIDLFPWCKDTHKDVSSGGDDKGENGSDNEVSSQTSEASDNTQDKEQEWNDDQMSYVCDSEDSTNSSEYMIPLPSPKMRSHGAVCIKEHPSKSDVEHTIVSTTDHNQNQQQRHGKNRKCNQKKVIFALEKEESVSYTDSSDSSDENNEHCSDYLPTESSSDEQMSPESNSEMDTQKRKGPGTSLKRNVDMRSSASDSEAGGNIVHSTSSSSSKLRLQNAECKVSSKTPESSCAVSSTTSETRFKKIPRVTVMTSSNGFARKWDKHQFCVFCMEQKAKLGRHFQSMHAHEPEVQEAFSFSKNSKERKELLQILTNKGNHSHNIEVLNSGTGILIPYKRPPFSVPFERYLPCENCFGYFYDGDMWKHTKKCPAKQSHSGRNNGLRSRCSLLLPLATKVDEQFKVKVIGIMRRDNISIICRNDEMILTLGQRLFAKLGTDSHNGQYVSQKMREVGRLLKNIQEVDPSLKTLAECIRPSCFDKVVEAVRKCAVYNSSTQQYQIPSLALKLGHSLKKCAAIQKVAGIKLEDGELKDYAERFEELCNLEWADSVSSHALSTLYQRKWNKPTILPLSEDVVNLHKHLNVKITESTKRLSTDPDKLAWYSLATATMAKIILFNRRRSGEVQRMPLEDYQRCNTHTNEDILEDLTEWEKKLCQQLSRVETKGKRGRKVPILLTSEMKEAADTLVETRSSVGVSSTNRYMFARPTLGSKTPLRGSDCLSKMALESGAKCPSALTSTKLRKHIATVSQLFCLKRHELDILANFLGHDIRVHREYYRLPDDTLQMTKVARLLLAMEKGNSNNFRDKKLSEIEVSLDDPCTSEEELVDEDEEDDLPDEINTGASILAKTCNESKKRSSLQARSHSNLSVRKPDQSEQRVVVNKKSHWGNKESDAVQDYFDKHIRLGRVPRKDECDKCKKSLAPLLDDKTWKNIKYKVYSAIQANKRKR